MSRNMENVKREPEKTPLIDIIFILLIFFLVTMTPNLGSDSGEGGKGDKIADMPAIENPNEIRGQYILIDVFDIQKGPVRQRDIVKNLNRTFNDLSREVGWDRKFASIPENGFMISVLSGIGYEDLAVFIDQSDSLIKQLEIGADIARIRREAQKLFVFYPDFIPHTPQPLSAEKENKIERKLNAMLKLLDIEKEPDVHIRMPENMYLFFLKSTFEILEGKGFDSEKIRIHAVKE